MTNALAAADIHNGSTGRTNGKIYEAIPAMHTLVDATRTALLKKNEEKPLQSAPIFTAILFTYDMEDVLSQRAVGITQPPSASEGGNPQQTFERYARTAAHIAETVAVHNQTAAERFHKQALLSALVYTYRPNADMTNLKPLVPEHHIARQALQEAIQEHHLQPV